MAVCILNDQNWLLCSTNSEEYFEQELYSLLMSQVGLFFCRCCDCGDCVVLDCGVSATPYQKYHAKTFKLF